MNTKNELISFKTDLARVKHLKKYKIMKKITSKIIIIDSYFLYKYRAVAEGRKIKKQNFWSQKENYPFIYAISREKQTHRQKKIQWCKIAKSHVQPLKSYETTTTLPLSLEGWKTMLTINFIDIFYTRKLTADCLFLKDSAWDANI